MRIQSEGINQNFGAYDCPDELGISVRSIQVKSGNCLVEQQQCLL